MTSTKQHTSTAEDEELRKTVNDLLPSHFDRSDVDLVVALIKSRDEQREREITEKIALIRSKYQKLENGIFAVMYYLDKPYPDDDRWTPYSRFIHPKMIMVRKALSGADVSEMWAIQESRRLNQRESPSNQSTKKGKV